MGLTFTGSATRPTSHRGTGIVATMAGAEARAFLSRAERSEIGQAYLRGDGTGVPCPIPGTSPAEYACVSLTPESRPALHVCLGHGIEYELYVDVPIARGYLLSRHGKASVGEAEAAAVDSILFALDAGGPA